jgi:glycosyltransferase involved in cell wall biosynthesis
MMRFKTKMARRILFLYVGDRLTGALISMLGLINNLPETSYEIMIATNHPEIISERVAGANIKVRLAALKTWSMIKEDYWLWLHDQKLTWMQRKAREWWHFLRFNHSLIGQIAVLRRLKREFRPDILHINGPSLIAAGAAGRLLRIPVVWHIRGILANNIWAAIARAIIVQTSAAIVCVSKAAAAPFAKARYKVQVVTNPVDTDRFHSKVQVVNDPIDTERFQPAESRELRREWGIPDTVTCVGYVGKFSHAKGTFDLLEAAAAIIAAQPNVRFVMVGYGTPDVEAQMKQKMAASGLEQYFHFTGVRQDIPAVLASLDIVVSPSWSEGANRPVIEAMAMQKAIVATNIAAVAELIEHGKSGLLVSPRQPGELAGAVLHMIRHPQFAGECAKAAYQTFHQRYLAQSSVQMIDQLYTRVLQSKRAARQEIADRRA